MKKPLDVSKLVDQTFSDKKFGIDDILKEIDLVMEGITNYEYKRDTDAFEENVDSLRAHFNGNSCDPRNPRNDPVDFDPQSLHSLARKPDFNGVGSIDEADQVPQAKNISLGDISIINPALISKDILAKGKSDENAFLRAVESLGIKEKQNMREKFNTINNLIKSTANETKGDIFKKFSSIYLLSSIIRTLDSMEAASFGFISEYIITSFYNAEHMPPKKGLLTDVLIQGTRRISCKTLSVGTEIKGSYDKLYNEVLSAPNKEIEIFLIIKRKLGNNNVSFDFTSRVIDQKVLPELKPKKGETQFVISQDIFKNKLPPNNAEPNARLSLERNVINKALRQNSESIIKDIAEIHKNLKDFTINFNNYIIPKPNGTVDDNAGRAAIEKSKNIHTGTETLVSKK